MNFIVTGGCGFIGHNVVRQLEKLGHVCFVLDNVTDYGFIPEEELNYLYQVRSNRMWAANHHVDLCDHAMVKQFFSNFSFRCDAVIHLASFPRQKVVSSNPVWGSEVMSTGLINLLEVCKFYNIPKFVYVSSSMVYGDFESDVTEDVVCRPLGQYGIMKLMGEDIVKDYTRRGHFDHVILRPSAVYGKYDVEDRVISKFILSAIKGQTLRVNGANEILDFTYVKDAAAGIVSATLSPNTLNKTYNITRGEGITLGDAAKLVKQIVGQGNIELRDKDSEFPSRGSLNIDQARQDFDFNPTIDLEYGLKRYYAWFLKSTYWKEKLSEYL